MTIEDIIYQCHKKGIKEDLFEQVSYHQKDWKGELSDLYKMIYYQLTNG